MERFGLNIFPPDFDLAVYFVFLALLALLLVDTFSALASTADLATFAIGSFRALDLALFDLPDLPNNGGIVVIML